MKILLSKDKFYLVQLSVLCVSLVSLGYLFYPTILGMVGSQTMTSEVVSSVPITTSPSAPSSTSSSSAPSSTSVPNPTQSPPKKPMKYAVVGAPPEVNIRQSITLPEGSSLELSKVVKPKNSIEIPTDQKIASAKPPITVFPEIVPESEESVQNFEKVEKPTPPEVRQIKTEETGFERYLRITANICGIFFPLFGAVLSLLWKMEIIQPPMPRSKRKRLMREEEIEFYT